MGQIDAVGDNLDFRPGKTACGEAIGDRRRNGNRLVQMPSNKRDAQATGQIGVHQIMGRKEQWKRNVPVRQSTNPRGPGPVCMDYIRKLGNDMSQSACRHQVTCQREPRGNIQRDCCRDQWMAHRLRREVRGSRNRARDQCRVEAVQQSQDMGAYPALCRTDDLKNPNSGGQGSAATRKLRW